MLTVSQEHIAIAPSVRGGKPCITGTRIAVEDVARMHLDLRQALATIAQQYNLPLAAVYAAMAYYFDHQEEIDQRTQTEDQAVENMKQTYPSLLEEKLNQRENY